MMLVSFPPITKRLEYGNQGSANGGKGIFDMRRIFRIHDPLNNLQVSQFFQLGGQGLCGNVADLPLQLIETDPFVLIDPPEDR